MKSTFTVNGNNRVIGYNRVAITLEPHILEVQCLKLEDYLLFFAVYDYKLNIGCCLMGI